MNKQISNQKPFFCGMTKNVHSMESIYLNTVYDSAIVEIDYQTKSVKYSLSNLITIETAELSKCTLALDGVGQNFLKQFLSENFVDLFNELQSRKDGVPPTLLWDLEHELRLAA